ncbi:MAG: DNA-processing protein DprA [Epsilonproteobacteria bacterium]|nr:DNA-processing protein DprA [Campylobacterota bacterium]
MSFNKIKIKELNQIKKSPKEIFYSGNKELLKKQKVSIVGTRRPNNYTKELTYTLAKEFSKRDIVVVSGAAMGVDAIAHKGAKANNTIAILGNGIDIKYPAVNKELIEEIEQKGLLLSIFEPGFRPTKWSFVVRNELVVALGEVLIVTEADLNSGSLRSVEFAKKMNKKIFVLPHRLNESLGTNELIKNKIATPIYDIDEFVDSFKKLEKKKEPLLEYLASSPTLNDALLKIGDKIYELELEGVIEIENDTIRLLI